MDLVTNVTKKSLRLPGVKRNERIIEALANAIWGKPLPADDGAALLQYWFITRDVGYEEIIDRVADRILDLV